MFYAEPAANSEAIAEKMQPEVVAGLRNFLESAPAAWQPAELSAALKASLASAGLKMPQLAMPLRLILMGRTDTPSIDKVMAVLGEACVRRRIEATLSAYGP
jgi:glutamyl-tRNA synthetase